MMYGCCFDLSFGNRKISCHNNYCNKIYCRAVASKPNSIMGEDLAGVFTTLQNLIPMYGVIPWGFLKFSTYKSFRGFNNTT